MKKRTTSDGRNAYGTGGSKTQRVYRYVDGKIARDEHGNPQIAGWRVCRYGYYTISITGSKGVIKHVREKTPWVSVFTSVHPDNMSSAEWRELDRKLDDLVEDSKTQLHQYEKARELIGQEKFDAAKRRLKRLPSHIGGELLKNMEHNIRSKDRSERYRCMLSACWEYLSDHVGVRAGKRTRQEYRSYVKNHIANWFGTLTIDRIDQKRLREFELASYAPRTGKRLARLDDDFMVRFWETGFLEFEECEFGALNPVTVSKIIKFMASVVEWCRQEPEKWGITKPVNVVAKFRLSKGKGTKKRIDVPRLDEFTKLVEAAEKHNLEYMVPLMALVRMAFRPAEARGLRWEDFYERDGKFFARVVGTIANTKGGEAWLPGAKTQASLETVQLPDSVARILLKHRKEGCEYVVPPAETTGKNAGRRVKPFLSKHDVEKGWKLLKQLTGIETDLYSLKHGLITELLLDGVPPATVTLLTRHTTTQMIMNVYASIQASDLANKIDQMHLK